MDYITDKIKIFTNAYNNSSLGSKTNLLLNNSNSNSNSNDNETFNLENNMIPAGLLLFVLSMLLYFVDITS